MPPIRLLPDHCHQGYTVILMRSPKLSIMGGGNVGRALACALSLLHELQLGRTRNQNFGPKIHVLLGAVIFKRADIKTRPASRIYSWDRIWIPRDELKTSPHVAPAPKGLPRATIARSLTLACLEVGLRFTACRLCLRFRHDARTFGCGSINRKSTSITTEATTGSP
jgi:hypothetical protein